MRLKIITSLVFLIAFAFSCVSDDDAGDVKIPVLGIYSLVGYNTNPGTDINNDKVSSENQILETDCHNSSFIRLNEDGTFTGRFTFLEQEINDTGMPVQNIICTTQDIQGTYTQENEVVVLNYVFNEIDQTLLMSLINGVMTSEEQSLILVNRDSEGAITTTNGTYVLVFEK
ncbi:hypothetical protein [Aquimarina algicola]|uniref:Lipocalin-like domain-containing protein n=1 Tax=Aquimarina algicola TaxID=2589995 RepID=A0A504J6F7_9FLAO|nr:hypothetical protein [Aquimarina algicola]TPN86094.1 hypothetical protein FHK87_12540 [Aquimarina algicola]